MESNKKVEEKIDRKSDVELVPNDLYWQGSCTGFQYTLGGPQLKRDLRILSRAGESTVMPSCHRQKGMGNFFLPTPRMQSAPRGQFSWGTRPFPPPLYQK